MIYYYIRQYERQRLYIYPICCQTAGKKIETNFTILDLKGGSSSLLSPSVQGFLKIAIQICQDYYPETLGMMYVINVSWIIKTGWWIVKPFLDAKTVAKIRIKGSEYEKELLQYVDAENLPKFLGGACECQPGGCVGANPGPWKTMFDQLPKETDPESVPCPPFPEKWKP
eukprot:TRINITY_DN2383_c0_g5_i1.p1 TRINITY_DN2383_c0_g5~~TRINITY_DN2383_c0_g5_i1.p1  ORF type:complete len:170 (-),score=32.28 TRINITY_DN2383_c0_g5_i1:167-676(-)